MKINLGCGGRYRPDWTNVDFVAQPPYVMSHDLSLPLPFAQNQADMVYASHVLEHFPRSEGLQVLRECHRVLAARGVIRIVVPDLEAIAQNYLRCLEARRSDSQLDPTDHLWSVLTLIDQLSRNQSGGEMVAFLQDRPAELLQNVFRLEGPEIEGLHHELLHTSRVGGAPLGRRFSIGRSFGGAVSHAKNITLQSIFGPHGQKYAKVGRFRLSGEVHYWMYDSVSLDSALSEAGFTDIVLRKADESYLPGWSDEHLDTEPDGRVYKPLSLFMEALKPG